MGREMEGYTAIKRSLDHCPLRSMVGRGNRAQDTCLTDALDHGMTGRWVMNDSQSGLWVMMQAAWGALGPRHPERQLPAQASEREPCCPPELPFSLEDGGVPELLARVSMGGALRARPPRSAAWGWGGLDHLSQSCTCITGSVHCFYRDCLL